jgi:hypothetical protein
MLLRGDRSMLWSDGPAHVGFGDTIVPALVNSQFLDIAQGIIQFCPFFVLPDGTFSANYQADIQAVGVALVVVDERALSLMQAKGHFSTVRGEFPLKTSDTFSTTYTEDWADRLDASDSPIPDYARGSIRIFERMFPVIR